jgi:hypothetical protein
MLWISYLLVNVFKFEHHANINFTLFSNMKDEYVFNESWIPISTTPPNATRCLVTDGDLVIIATYLQSEESFMWMFSELEKGTSFNVIGWMPLPRPMKKFMEVIGGKESLTGSTLVNG